MYSQSTACSYTIAGTSTLVSTRTGGSAARQAGNVPSPVRAASTVSSEASSRSECTARRYSLGVRQNANGMFIRHSAV